MFSPSPEIAPGLSVNGLVLGERPARKDWRMMIISIVIAGAVLGWILVMLIAHAGRKQDVEEELRRSYESDFENKWRK